MAKFSRYLKPAGILLKKLLPEESKAALTMALERLASFFQSPAIAELSPGSPFMAAIDRPLPETLPTLSFGGTSPALFQLDVNLPGNFRKIIKFPDLLVGAVPGNRLPRELTPGLGDALVTAESATLPNGRHINLPDNHVKAAYNSRMHTLVRDFLLS